MTKISSQSLLSLLTLFTTLGICVHDTHVDKAAVSAITTYENYESSKSGGPSSNLHTHTENVRYAHSSRVSSRDPREDGPGTRPQIHITLPGNTSNDNHTVVLA